MTISKHLRKTVIAQKKKRGWQRSRRRPPRSPSRRPGAALTRWRWRPGSTAPTCSGTAAALRCPRSATQTEASARHFQHAPAHKGQADALTLRTAQPARASKTWARTSSYLEVPGASKLAVHVKHVYTKPSKFYWSKDLVFVQYSAGLPINFKYWKHSNPPVSAGNAFQDPQWHERPRTVPDPVHTMFVSICTSYDKV